MVNLAELIRPYLQMDILGKSFNCPYWSNKLKNGKVVLRGFLDGKGDAVNIERELLRLLKSANNKENILADPVLFRKFAKRNRIGIDCSGFVFRILENIFDMSKIFSGGINRTNADTLTSLQYCLKVNRVRDIRPADLIRFDGGGHVAVIFRISKSRIKYAHSASRVTKIQGVHQGSIEIDDPDSGLEKQIWLEKTQRNENFGKRYFKKNRGDGIYRLKIKS